MAKKRVSAEDYKLIEEQSSAAKYFLENNRFDFIRAYLLDIAQDIENKVINNQILEVREELSITENLKRVFITPKKQQLDELKGVYKTIKKFFDDMEIYANLKDNLEREAEKGHVNIERSKDETV